MLNIPAQLKDAITEGRICRYALVVLKDGTEIAVTDYDHELVVGGVTFMPSPSVTSLQMLQTSNAQVSTQKIFSTWFQGYFTETELVAGKYDDSELECGWIGYDMPTPERMVLFSGLMGEISFNDEGISMEALDDMKSLDKNIGRTYTVNDPYSFGDTQWGLNVGSYRKNGYVDYVLTQRLKIKVKSHTYNEAFLIEDMDDGMYSYGSIEFTSGANAGYTGEVKIHSKDQYGAALEFFIPTPYPLEVGDTFLVVQGYDGSFDQCKNKFVNAVNFGGFPHILPLTDN